MSRIKEIRSNEKNKSVSKQKKNKLKGKNNTNKIDGKECQRSTHRSVIEVRLIMATNPIIHHLEVLAIRMLYVQACDCGDPLVQLPYGGVCCVLQPGTGNKTFYKGIDDLLSC